MSNDDTPVHGNLAGARGVSSPAADGHVAIWRCGHVAMWPFGDGPSVTTSANHRGDATMGLINWIFDFYQQYRIDQLRDEAARTRAEASSVRSPTGNVDADRLERAIGELAPVSYTHLTL